MSDSREIRRYRRMKGWDYRRGAVLFVTIVTEPRRAILGRVVDGKVLLSPLGEVVARALADMTRLNPGIVVHGRAVMPDHIHFNVHIQAGLEQPLKVFGKAIARFKNFTLKRAKEMGLVGGLVGHSPTIATAGGRITSGTAAGLVGHSPTISTALGNAAATLAHGADASEEGRAAPGRSAGLWQQGCHDRLCLRRAFIDATERYIAYNAPKWQLMYGAGETLRIHEPLEAACLDPGDYWKGVGNVALLDEKIVSLRVSRQICAPAAVAAVVARMKRAVESGFVILSGFISPGEKAVRDMLCATPGARFIRILPSCIPNARFKPESRYVPAFAEGRYLEIAQGNDEVAFGRDACLDYNAEIVAIAQASAGGLALYWKSDGVHRLGDWSGIARPSPLPVGGSPAVLPRDWSGAARPSPLPVGGAPAVLQRDWSGAARPSPLPVGGSPAVLPRDWSGIVRPSPCPLAMQ